MGPAGYGLAAGGGWRTLWCRRGRTVGGSGFLGWVQVGVLHSLFIVLAFSM